ncbi:tyrosine-protein phosphatase, partial [Achromobacter denitrificans]|uniref:tyrosine-protein phosphatase n=1 Tax=Achromobacter denitrificans TaxID=32002 RepID=UPI0024327C2B
GLPTMIHCSAGKDRTGFACAILLKALGVDDEEIMADYLRAGESLVGTPIADEMAAALAALIDRPIAADAMAAIMSVRREYLETSLEAIDEHYGGIDHYLRRAGLGDRIQERLRGLLLTHGA